MPAALFSMGDLKDAIECYQALKDEVQERVDNGIGAIEEEKYRLFFADLAPRHSLRTHINSLTFLLTFMSWRCNVFDSSLMVP